MVVDLEVLESSDRVALLLVLEGEDGNEWDDRDETDEADRLDRNGAVSVLDKKFRCN